jgi:hypothetical protein
MCRSTRDAKSVNSGLKLFESCDLKLSESKRTRVQSTKLSGFALLCRAFNYILRPTVQGFELHFKALGYSAGL